MTPKLINFATILLTANLTACAAQPRPVEKISAPPATVAPDYSLSTLTPTTVAREFRAAWISSVGENSWLNGLTGKSTAEQKAALTAMLDRAVALKLNAIIFQVRPACDAVYASSIEPWCEHLTGIQGRAPQPFYDPLEFVITEAHKRGLELHAWFNPYRAHHADAKSPIAPNHISRTRPDLVRSYGKFLWLDPGERDVQDYSLRVVMDVVKRYDIDGVHFDDYFYPYREKNYAGRPVDFPDAVSWKKFGVSSGLSREDWRRDNVNSFIQRAGQAIHAAKPWVKFGISPFGIWRPGNPLQIKGKDSYAELYADSRKWLANGWADYFSPQLYWDIENREQSFPALLKWWNEQNLQHRHLWPGLDATKVSEQKWPAAEIAQQIRITRQINPPGEVFWGMKNLMSSQGGLAATLARDIYNSPALVPATPWLATNTLGKPVFFMSGLQTTKLRFMCNPAEGSLPALWVLQTKFGERWTTEFVPGKSFWRMLGNSHPDALAVTEIDRFGRASQPVVFEKTRVNRR